jgi:hypothetical protein
MTSDYGNDKVYRGSVNDENSQRANDTLLDEEARGQMTETGTLDNPNELSVEQLLKAQKAAGARRSISMNAGFHHGQKKNLRDSS